MSMCVCMRLCTNPSFFCLGFELWCLSNIFHTDLCPLCLCAWPKNKKTHASTQNYKSGTVFHNRPGLQGFLSKAARRLAQKITYILRIFSEHQVKWIILTIHATGITTFWRLRVTQTFCHVFSWGIVFQYDGTNSMPSIETGKWNYV